MPSPWGGSRATRARTRNLPFPLVPPSPDGAQVLDPRGRARTPVGGGAIRPATSLRGTSANLEQRVGSRPTCGFWLSKERATQGCLREGQSSIRCLVACEQVPAELWPKSKRRWGSDNVPDADRHSVKRKPLMGPDLLQLESETHFGRKVGESALRTVGPGPRILAVGHC